MLATDELRGRAEALRREALGLLEGGVQPLLRDALGEVEVAGSVALDLMVWPDIDLFARLEPADAPRLLGLVPRLAEVLAHAGHPVARVAFRDEHRQRDPSFPDAPGLYLGVTTAAPGRGWKLDLWGWGAAGWASQRRRHHELADRLTHADRDLILRVKDAAHGQPGYRSVDVYAFVLAGAGDTFEAFERFRAEQLGAGAP